MGTTLAAAVMGTILTTSTTAFGQVELPSRTAFTWCFAVGAAAALLGVLLASFIPARDRAVRAGGVPEPTDSAPALSVSPE